MTEKQRKGFAVMTPEQRSAIASKGGKAARAKGTAHQFTPAEAKIAGAKGGAVAGKGRPKAKPIEQMSHEELEEREADIRRSET